MQQLETIKIRHFLWITSIWLQWNAARNVCWYNVFNEKIQNVVEQWKQWTMFFNKSNTYYKVIVGIIIFQLLISSMLIPFSFES